MQAVSINPTFGIEIECLYLFDTNELKETNERQESPDSFGSFSVISLSSEDSFEELEASLTRGVRAVHDALSIPLDVACSTCSEVHLWRLPLYPLTVQDDDLEDYDCWTVQQDSSVRLPSSVQALFPNQTSIIQGFSIELTSRVMPFRGTFPTVARAGTNHVHAITSQVEIEAIYTRLRTAFNTFSATARHDHRLVINSTCSTHVHVGNGQDGFTLSTIKNLLSTVVACERVIDSLHATERIGGSTLSMQPQNGTLNTESARLQPVEFNMPWSAHLSRSVYNRRQGRVNSQHYPEAQLSNLAASQAAFASLQVSSTRYDIPSWLDIIQKAREIADLMELQFAAAHFSTVNLQNLGLDKRTVEFRQHAGTLQSAEALAWVEVCGCLMEFASSTSEAAVKALCDGEWSGPLHTANDLLLTIGVSRKTRDHYRKVVAVPLPSDGDYAAQVLRQELALANAWPSDSVLGPLVEYLIRERCNQLKSKTVATRIHAKLTNGCYGRFPSDVLDVFSLAAEGDDGQLVLTSAQQTRLTIGYVVPLP